MKCSSRRHGVGTLLIIVLVVLASLFVMAMMQYFASTVTKGKRILAHIAVTDYACEAALDEAVLWFKGHANDPQDQDAMKLHKELVNSGNAKAATTKKAKETVDLFKSLYKDYLVINDVDISVSNVSKIGHTGKLGKNKFFETEGIVNFSVTAKYETTKKTAVRSIEFRQVVCAPPQDYANFQFVATDFGYLKRRVAKYIYDQSKLSQAMATVAAKVYFGFSMLTYIVDPGNAAVGGGGPFSVGLNFIKQVKQQALTMSPAGFNDPAVADKLKRGMDPAHGKTDGLDKWADHYQNPNFNVQYVDAMANADTSNLEKALNEMKQSDFGFNPGPGGALSGSDGYPLSAPGSDGKPSESTSTVLGNGSGYGFKPAQKWGIGGEMKGEVFQKAKLEFQGESGKLTVDQVAAKMSLSPDGSWSEANNSALAVVVPARPSSSEFSLHGLEFFIHPPPCLPSVDDKPNDALQGDQGVEGIDASASMNADDIKKMDQSGGDGKLMGEMASGNGWGEGFKDLQKVPDNAKGVSKLNKDDYRLPGLSLWHPKSYEDWAFRMPVKFWKANFKDHYDAFKNWKDKTLAAAKYYKDTMENANQNLSEFMIRDGSSSGSAQTPQAAPLPVEPAKLYERASYRFDTTKDFDAAMKALSEANGNANQLVMNGVYYIGPKQEAPQGGQGQPAQPAQGQTPAGPLEITQKEYVGQGEIVATDALILKNGLACKSKDRDVPMVLYSASDKPFELSATDPIQASIIVNSVLKSKDTSHINGVFVVKDAVCAAAVDAPMDTASKLEIDQVQHYYRTLPDVKIKHPDYANKEPVFYSQITFSPYRTSSGGARMAR